LKTLEQAKFLLAENEEFTTGTLSARYDDNGRYFVWSYNALIAWKDGERTWITDEKFSQTTSKHTNIIAKAWGLN
jgi:hypothetical protein